MGKTHAAEITWVQNDNGDRWYGRINGAEDVLAFQASRIPEHAHLDPDIPRVEDAYRHYRAVGWTDLEWVDDAAYMQITKLPSGRFVAVFQARSKYARQTRYYASLTEAQEDIRKWGSRKFRKAL